MASILIRLISASTFPAEEASTLAPCSYTNNTTPITTHKLEGFPRGPAPVRPFGRRNSIVITSPLQRMTRKKRQSWSSSLSREKRVQEAMKR